jgi:hypothetical protein
MQRLRKDPPIGKGGRFQLRPGLVHRNSTGTGWKRIVRTVRYALQNSFAGPSQSGASVERTRQALRRQSKLLHGAAQSHPRILLVSCAQTTRYFVRSKWAPCLNRYRSPFTVRRSRFAVHRSPFTVRRSPFGGERRNDERR